MPDTLLLDRHEGVLTVTFNRPDRRNAFNIAMLRELDEALKSAERDDAIRALVLTGAGQAFCSGQDLGEFDRPGAPESADPRPDLGGLLRQRVNPLVLRLRGLEKPVLAAVNGVAAGAGMGLALGCDIRYAAESARFIQAFVNIGLVPDAGSSYFLVRLVGMSKALELAWTGEAVGAQEALELGMVNLVLPDAEVLPRTQQLAARLATGPQKAIALTKRAMTRSHELPLDRVLDAEAHYQEIAARDPDFHEGLHAFLEKRPAIFGGRPNAGPAPSPAE